MCVRERAPSGPLWQAHTVAAVRGQSSTLHTTWCKICEVLHCCLVSRGACSPWWCYFHRDNVKNKAHPRKTNCKLWNQTKLKIAALNFYSLWIIINPALLPKSESGAALFTSDVSISLQFCRFNPKTIFDVSLVRNQCHKDDSWASESPTTHHRLYNVISGFYS